MLFESEYFSQHLHSHILENDQETEKIKFFKDISKKFSQSIFVQLFT